MRNPRATSAGPAAAGATASIKLGSTIETFIPRPAPPVQRAERPRLFLAGNTAARAARALAERLQPVAPSPPEAPAEPAPPAEATPPGLVPQPGDSETIASNHARTAERQTTQNKAKVRAKAAKHTLAARLRYLAPLVFGDHTVPLKIGIDRDIAAQLAGEAEKATIGRFLRCWTRRSDYLRAVAAGTMRRDLAGNPTGHPDLHQRQSAAKWLVARLREVVR